MVLLSQGLHVMYLSLRNHSHTCMIYELDYDQKKRLAACYQYYHLDFALKVDPPDRRNDESAAADYDKPKEKRKEK